MAFKNDGTLTGLRYRGLRISALSSTATPAIQTLTGLKLSGAYNIPRFR